MNSHRNKLNELDRLAWLRLARTENIGPSTFASLLSNYGNIGRALDAVPGLARRGGGNLKPPSNADAKRELDGLAAMSGRMIACIEPDFPTGLATLDPPPPLIAVLGHAAILSEDMVAIVGARNASALGIKFARRLASALGDAGLIVVSGLARGVDHAAHQGALDTGTVAVVAGGIDVVYPPEHQSIYESIRERGAIVSEMPLGTTPQPRHFPRRNRIISGLARGVVVIEAAERSGSLITARYALEQGREVFAVPGSPLDPRAKGANRLIRDGAILTETADDVLEVLSPMLGRSFHESSAPEPAESFSDPVEPGEKETNRARTLVEEKLSPSPVELDELVRQCEGPAPAVLTAVLELELAGRVLRHPGNRVSWR